MTNKDYIFYGDFDGIVGYLFTSDTFGPNVLINNINDHSKTNRYYEYFYENWCGFTSRYNCICSTR